MKERWLSGGRQHGWAGRGRNTRRASQRGHPQHHTHNARTGQGMMQKIWNPFSRGRDVGGLAEVVHWSHSWALAMPYASHPRLRSAQRLHAGPTEPLQHQQAQTHYHPVDHCSHWEIQCGQLDVDGRNVGHHRYLPAHCKANSAWTGALAPRSATPGCGNHIDASWP